MLHKSTTPRTGNRSTRLGPHRAGIQKRSRDSSRTDKDLAMDIDTSEAVIGKGHRDTRRERSSLRTRGGAGSGHEVKILGSARTSLNSAAVQKAIIRGLGSEETITRALRQTPRSARPMGKLVELDRGAVPRGLTQLVVRGFKDSKAASNRDGGIKDLLAFLERKASADLPARETVKIKKSRLDGDVLVISVRSEDVSKMESLDNFKFAGATLQIKRHEEDTDMQNAIDIPENSVILTLQSVLSRRYSSDLKLLDLSNLGADPELVNMGMFQTSSRESKFFPALMKVCDRIFTTSKEKDEAITSVSLAGNALTSIASVTSLAQTFPSLLNLDLSNNEFRNLETLEGWRRKFRKLDHLILSGNPLEAEGVSYKETVLRWYPTLRMLNKVQVRSSNEVRDVPKVDSSIPILGPSFRDEANIGETFIRHFFPAYDSDRTALAHGYYDAKSTFSLNINVSAPRAPEVVTEKPPSWDHYIKKSRNLVKVKHLPAMMSRMYTGVENIEQCWVTLPSTHHPDLLVEPQKWCIEGHSIPGLPDPSGSSLGGVGGLIIMVHGEFSEVDVSTGQTANKRSFDRTFVLGPGGGVGGVRVVCDTLVLRAYGGSDAWKPSVESISTVSQGQTSGFTVAIPDGFGVTAPGKSDEQVHREMAAVELSKMTGMTLEYSGMCLQESGWALEGALVAFANVKVRFGSFKTWHVASITITYSPLQFRPVYQPRLL